MSRKHADFPEMVINRPMKPEKVEVLGHETPAEFNGETVVRRPRKRESRLHERTADKGNWSF